MSCCSLYSCNAFTFFDTFVTSVMALVPYRVSNGYQALLYAMFVVTLPFGLSLIVKLKSVKPNNVDPRKQNEVLAATNPLFGRLMVRTIL